MEEEAAGWDETRAGRRWRLLGDREKPWDPGWANGSFSGGTSAPTNTPSSHEPRVGVKRQELDQLLGDRGSTAKRSCGATNGVCQGA